MKRFLEILPGFLSWAVLFGLLFLSWRVPGVVAIFIVLYDLYWLVKISYLVAHLRLSFRTMRDNMDRDWLKRLKQERRAWERIHHLVVFPMFHEPYEVVRASIRSVAEANYPKKRFWVVLATEARGGMDDAATAARIAADFQDVFGGFLVTAHPSGIAGELSGKGSNETWAAREALERLVDPSGVPYKDVLVSVFDSDTRPGPNYFGILTHRFLTEPNSERASYQPVPLFTNNIEEVPLFARITAFSSTFWQLMQQSRSQQLVTFSSHSMPLKPLVEIGFWDTGIVSEDSRIFFQCLIHFKGDWRTVPLLYPIYMDAVGGRSFWKALKNLYLQQRRWAWGVENVPYVLGAFLRSHTIPLKRRLYWSFILLEGFNSWATNSLIIFLFGWLPNALGGAVFHTTLLSYNMTKITGVLINLSILGIVSSALFNVFLLPRPARGNSFAYYALSMLQWILMPATIIFFGSVPALESQTRLMLGGRFRLGFWRTPKLRAAPAA